MAYATDSNPTRLWQRIQGRLILLLLVLHLPLLLIEGMLRQKCGDPLGATGNDYLNRNAARKGPDAIPSDGPSRILASFDHNGIIHGIDLSDLIGEVLSDLEVTIVKTGGEVRVWPLQRLHGRSEYAGTGKGLTIRKKIVERHAGNITARSTPGVDTTIMITLPGA